MCRCGRIHTQHGVVRVSKLPPGWHETSDAAEQPQPECPNCHKKTVARRETGAQLT
jgi:ribosomal protein L37AE/L43A